MAVSISATADERIIRLQMRDVDTETVVKVFSVDGQVTDLALAAIFDNLDALTNSGVIKASVSSAQSATGWAAATDALQNSVGYIMALTFTQADPVNAAKTITKSFIVPAPINALKDTDKKPVTNNADLNALITFLEDNLAFVGADGVIRAGGWAYQRTMSGFGTTNREIDGI